MSDFFLDAGAVLFDLITKSETEYEWLNGFVYRSSDVPTIQSIVLDISKLKELTGYQPAVTLREGIQKETERIRKELKL